MITERLEQDGPGGAPTWEFRVQGFGPDGKSAADTLADAVRT
ncbi:hypothetical protein SLAV_39035 [Streptomyces lavendulae subsp. lavendulae]|uniref:Uncharacterized protein n=1 Tax=Streptomyces lavendulae subsp. lavendulae TaxID=58340 RepID=A0A2K8PTW7_STRLA|nr:hypothetical protein [Streptomyces lavendulae]ATZ22001.1 hypothetical protein SLAV_00355 [Streptomyces lavendulae subsp. lavendulae]ATZ29570.1 hypothetical protein SLAV_39035 [Streptomyces lavendulae subsp. lavendulae]